MAFLVMALPNVRRSLWFRKEGTREICYVVAEWMCVCYPSYLFLCGRYYLHLLVLNGTTEKLQKSFSSPRVRKILNLRVFEDESGKHWSKSVMDKQYEVLCVSQFTLQCILKGNKPDYHMAMPTEQAESFYNNFLEQLRKAYKPELIKGKGKRLVRSLLWPVDFVCMCFSVIDALFCEFLSVLQRSCRYAALSEGIHPSRVSGPSGLPLATPFPGIPLERFDI